MFHIQGKSDEPRNNDYTIFLEIPLTQVFFMFDNAPMLERILDILKNSFKCSRNHFFFMKAKLKSF